MRWVATARDPKGCHGPFIMYGVPQIRGYIGFRVLGLGLRI